MASRVRATSTTRASRARPCRSRVVSTAAKLTGDNWCPGSVRPAHLDGTMPGDNAFDPLGLGKDGDVLPRLREAELIHARWAMLGAAGVIAVELTGNGSWIEAPLPLVKGGTASYLGNEIPLSLPALAISELFMMGYIEAKRGGEADYNKRLYPGGAFDPLGFADGKDPAKVFVLKEKEIANGRLAMVAMLGFFMQADATKVGPLANLATHFADPWAVNVATNGESLPFLK